MTFDVSTRVGNRYLVAHGILLLLEGDVVGVVQVDDLEFIFTFLPFPGVAPTAERSLVAEKTVGITISGQSSTVAMWVFKDIARLNGRLLSLNISVQHLSGLPERAAAIRLEYNFLLGEQAPAGWGQ
jgi:hypothetical protein